jgi:hypothetical protein
LRPILQCGVVEHSVGQQLLEPGVLALERLNGMPEERPYKAGNKS